MSKDGIALRGVGPQPLQAGGYAQSFFIKSTECITSTFEIQCSIFAFQNFFFDQTRRLIQL